MFVITPFSKNSDARNIQQQSFGLNYKKNTAKLLKKAIPDLIKTDEDFSYAQKAISNFGELAKRNDGFTFEISEIYPNSTSSDFSGVLVSNKNSKLNGHSLHEQVIDWVINKTHQGKKGLDSYAASAFEKISDDFQALCHGSLEDKNTEKLFSDFKSQRAQFEQNGKVPYPLKSCYYYWDMLSGKNERKVTRAQDLFNISEYLKTNEFLQNADLALNRSSESDAVGFGAKILSSLSSVVQKAKKTYYRAEDFINYFGYSKNASVDNEKRKILTAMIDENVR